VPWTGGGYKIKDTKKINVFYWLRCAALRCAGLLLDELTLCCRGAAAATPLLHQFSSAPTASFCKINCIDLLLYISNMFSANFLPNDFYRSSLYISNTLSANFLPHEFISLYSIFILFFVITQSRYCLTNCIF
jgi:hypothetical protein